MSSGEFSLFCEQFAQRFNSKIFISSDLKDCSELLDIILNGIKLDMPGIENYFMIGDMNYLIFNPGVVLNNRWSWKFFQFWIHYELAENSLSDKNEFVFVVFPRNDFNANTNQMELLNYSIVGDSFWLFPPDSSIVNPIYYNLWDDLAKNQDKSIYYLQSKIVFTIDPNQKNHYSCLTFPRYSGNLAEPGPLISYDFR